MSNPQVIQQKLLSAIKFHQQGNFAKAKQLYKEVLRLQPNNDIALNFLGLIAFHFNELEEALSYQQKAFAINPQANYLKDIGDIFVKRNEPDKAVEFYQHGLSLDPANGDLIHCQGLAHMDLKEYVKAEQNFLKALSSGTSSPAETLYNLGVSCYEQNKFNEALSCYSKVLELNPQDARTYHAIGVVLYDLNRLEESIKYYETAIQLNPDFPDAYFGASYSYLKMKNFKKGWEYYEYRFTKTLPVALPVFNNPKWNGSDPNGKRILVFLEQGLGDAFIFARYLPILHQMGAKVITAPLDSLKRIFKDSFPFVEYYDTYEDIKDNDYDYFIPAMSFPLMLKTEPDTIPFTEGYLKADHEKVKLFKDKFFNNEELKIGLVWQCKNKYAKDKTRSIQDLKQLEKLFKIEGTKFYSIQKGEAEVQLNHIDESIRPVNLGKEFNDFADTAAAIENLDIMISVDTSVLHLAGGIGKETLLPIPYDSDWKWFMDLEATPWYNSVKIFKQTEIGNWTPVIERIYELIAMRVKGK